MIDHCDDDGGIGAGEGEVGHAFSGCAGGAVDAGGVGVGGGYGGGGQGAGIGGWAGAFEAAVDG